MKPEISTMSADADAHVSALAESVDCHALHVDFQRVAERSVGGRREVSAAARGGGGSTSSASGGGGGIDGGVFGQIWRGVVDDLGGFGAVAAGGRKVGFV
jgi:hypothetical protein